MIIFTKAYARNIIAGLVKPLQLLWFHRNLFLLLIKRDLKVRTSGTKIGVFWNFLQPALQIFLFWFLLDFVLRVRFPGEISLLDYMLIGMVPWLMISEIMNRSLSVLSDFQSFYQKSIFPIAILPLLPILISGSVYALVYSGVVLFLYDSVTCLKAPFLIISILILLIPVAYLLSVLGLFVKDIAHIFTTIITMFMYLTPILYLPEMLPEVLSPWLVLNPLADIMAIIHAVIQDTTVTLGNFIRPILLWILLLAPAWVLFKRAEPHIREAL